MEEHKLAPPSKWVLSSSISNQRTTKHREITNQFFPTNFFQSKLESFKTQVIQYDEFKENFVHISRINSLRVKSENYGKWEIWGLKTIMAKKNLQEKNALRYLFGKVFDLK